MALSTVTSLTESYVSGVSSLTNEDIPVKEKSPQQVLAASQEPMAEEPVADSEPIAEYKDDSSVQGSVIQKTKQSHAGKRENSDDEDVSEDEGVLAVHD
jgi:hypothetical protein